MSFENLQLSASILKAVARCGYTSPTPVQEQAIPEVMAGHDLIAIAQTGTGKTAAFVLPALHRLIEPSAVKSRGPRVLVLVPTRELANQITEAVCTYGKYMRVRSVAILGGMPYREQLQLLSQSVDMVVATPGRLIDHLENRKIDLSHLEILVLDEADRMLDMGFSEDVYKIATASPSHRQTLLFAATMDNGVVRMAQCLLKQPMRIEVTGPKATLENIEQRLHVADDLLHKNLLLQNIIEDAELTRAIIFSATKRGADAMAQKLLNQGHSVAALHGDMTQGARNRTIANMRRGKLRLLVATDVAARGLDVDGISHVINFDLPKLGEDYIHRIGRTGRAGAAGIAISFASLNDLSSLEKIERYIGQPVPQHVIPGLEPSHPQWFSRDGKQNRAASVTKRRYTASQKSCNLEERARIGGNSSTPKWGRKRGQSSTAYGRQGRRVV